MKIQKTFINSVFILGAVALIELSNSVFLGRWLPAEDFGKFKIYNTVIMLMGGILVLGQDIVFVRTLCQNNGLKYNWRFLLRKILIFGFIISLPLIAFISWFYNFRLEALYILIGSTSLIIIKLNSSINRALGNTTMSLFIEKTPSILLLVVILSSFLANKINYDYVLMGYSAVWIFTLFIANYSTSKIKSGSIVINKEMMATGYLIFFISISFVLMKNIDRFFIAKMLSFSEVGAYSAVITVTQGFAIAATGIWYVLMPRYAKNEKVRLWRDFKILLFIGLGIGLIYFIWGSWLLHILFKGKFDEFSYLLKYFILIGVCSMIYVIPGSFIGAKSTRKALILFMGINVFTVILNCFGNYYLILRMGLCGATISTLICWVIRIVSSFYIMKVDI